MPFVKVDHANTSVLTLATPTSDDRVVLTGGVLCAANTVTLTFSSASNTVTGAMTMIVGVPLVLPSSTHSPGSGRRPGYLQTARGEALTLTLGGNTQVSGSLEYVFRSE